MSIPSDHSPARVLATFLVGAGQVVLGSVREDDTAPPAWPAFTGKMPAVTSGVPIDAVALIDTTPIKDGRLMTGANIYHYGVQILIRSQTYPSGWSKISAIHNQLELVRSNVVAIGSLSFTLRNVSVASGPVYIGQEPDTESELFSLNVLVTLQ